MQFDSQVPLKNQRVKVIDNLPVLGVNKWNTTKTLAAIYWNFNKAQSNMLHTEERLIKYNEK